MEEPLCHANFDFEFERNQGGAGGGAGAGGGGGDGVIPRPELQAMMFTEMQELLSSKSYALPSPASRVSMGATAAPDAGGGGGGGGGARADGKEDDNGTATLSMFCVSIYLREQRCVPRYRALYFFPTDRYCFHLT